MYNVHYVHLWFSVAFFNFVRCAPFLYFTTTCCFKIKAMNSGNQSVFFLYAFCCVCFKNIHESSAKELLRELYRYNCSLPFSVVSVFCGNLFTNIINKTRGCGRTLTLMAEESKDGSKGKNAHVEFKSQANKMYWRKVDSWSYSASSPGAFPATLPPHLPPPPTTPSPPPLVQPLVSVGYVAAVVLNLMCWLTHCLNSSSAINPDEHESEGIVTFWPKTQMQLGPKKKHYSHEHPRPVGSWGRHTNYKTYRKLFCMHV